MKMCKMKKGEGEVYINEREKAIRGDKWVESFQGMLHLE